MSKLHTPSPRKMITANFGEDELWCSHCHVTGIDKEFAKLLQQLRDSVGHPLKVNSGFRCAAHPVERVKKPGTFSAHTYGIAADITCPALSLEKLFLVVIQQPLFKGIGVAPWQNYIHIDSRSKTARWAYNRMNSTVGWSGKWEDLEEATGFSFNKVE